MKKKKKHSITLIEIMIVILLIGLIGGALAYNMSGRRDKGNSFKTEQNLSRLHDILMLEYATGTKTLAEIISDKRVIVKDSPLAPKDVDAMLKDGWGQEFVYTIENHDIKITQRS